MKYIIGQLIVLMVVISIILLLLITFIIRANERWENAPCSEFRDNAVQYLPVRCLEYWKSTPTTSKGQND